MSSGARPNADCKLLDLGATQIEYSAHGSGPLVEGPAVALMLATTGRRAALADLHGPGVETLRSR